LSTAVLGSVLSEVVRIVVPMTTSAAALTAVVDALVEVRVSGLCASQLQDGIAAVSAQVARLDGWLSVASGQLQATTGGQVTTADGGERSVVGWLAGATCAAPGTAGSQLRTAAALRSLPLIIDAVLDGVLTQGQAAVLARLVGPIPAEHLAASQAELVQVAAGRDPAQLAVWVRHLIATHCEPALEDDERAAHDARYLQTRREDDGSVRGRFLLPGADAETLLTALEPLARRAGDSDLRSAGQRRADALVELADQVLRHGDLPEHGGQRPQLSYLLPAGWAARQADRAHCPTCARCPQHRPAGFADTVLASQPGTAGVPAEHACAAAAWTGPQTRTRIETMLCEARISRVLLDSVGQVRRLETLTDTVTAAQRRALAARDLGCAARGCTRPPAGCDAHHLIPLADGGTTALANLVLLCRRHHVLWHLGQLRLVDLHVPWHPEASGAGPPRK